jgi:TRAP-type C4-dicarboxylate transport system substrate-binding protein
MLPMNAVFMPFAPLVSGRIWQTLDDKDKDLIRGLTTKVLDEQIKDIVNTELGLIEKLKTAGTVSIKQDSSFNPAEVIKAFDAMWLPKAPQITDLRKVASSL